MRFVLTFLALLGMSTGVDAAPRHPTPHHNTVRVRQFNFYHRPGVVLYGSYGQFRQVGYAMIGYTDLVAVQGLVGQYGFQVVQVYGGANQVLVRLPVGFSWNAIVGISHHSNVRFIQPHHHR